MKKKSALVGRKAYVKPCVDSWASREWGIIKLFDGQYYHLAIANGDITLIFTRSELHIPRKPKHTKYKYEKEEMEKWKDRTHYKDMACDDIVGGY